MNFQIQITKTWILRWLKWDLSEQMFCFGVHYFPYGGPIDSFMIHAGFFMVLFTKAEDEISEKSRYGR